MSITTSYNPKSILNTHLFTTIRCKSCGHIHTVPAYCGNRFCPVCSKPRMMRIKFRLLDLMNKIQLGPGEGFSHLVLTIRSQSDVKKMCDYLIRCFSKFRNRCLYKKNFRGGAYVLELTFNDSGWHAHLHVIVQNRFVPQTELLSCWRSIVDGGGLFIKRIPKKAIINYLSKYMCKVELDEKIMEDAGKILKGRRLFTVIGIWHELIKGWSKIPFECPSCGNVLWSIALDLSFEEHVSIDDELRAKYG